MARDIKVYNESGNAISVQINTERSRVVEKKSYFLKDMTFEEFKKAVHKGKIDISTEMNIDVAGIAGGGGKLASGVDFEYTPEYQKKLREIYDRKQEVKYEWSEFIKDGAQYLDKGEVATVHIGDAKDYFISISLKDKLVANAIRRTEDELTITKNSIVKGNPSIFETINSNTPLSLKVFSKDLYFTHPSIRKDPIQVGMQIVAYNTWINPRVSDVPCIHYIKQKNDSNKDLESGDLVAIVIEDKNSSYNGSSLRRMAIYNSIDKNLDYDWIVRKTAHKDNSEGKTIRYGDEIKFEREDKDYYLCCVKEDNRVGIIDSERDHLSINWSLEKV